MDDFTWADNIEHDPLELLRVGDFCMVPRYGTEIRAVLFEINEEWFIFKERGVYRYSISRNAMYKLIEKGRIKKKCGMSYTSNLLRWA